MKVAIRMGTRSPRVHGRLATVVAIAALLALCIGVSPAAAEDFGSPEAGRTVYDRSGLLTPAELNMLEQRAAEVIEAGAPVVVYLRAHEADFDETLEDARELMEAWDVQSQPAARDGVVIFLNLEPKDLRHGQLAVVAGATHYDGGNLPQHELERITDEMRAVLGDGETAAGIATGLEMIANSLVSGPTPPPEPSRAERLAADAARGPLSFLNVLSALVVAAIGIVSFRIWDSRPNISGPMTRTTQPPDDLIPAAAGALVTGRINDMQMEATILDLARRGALAVEPEDGKKKVQIRLIDAGVVANELELQVFNALETEANADRIVTSKNLSKVRSHWQPAKDALQSGLESRGWYEPDAGPRRRPAYIAGAVALVLAVVTFVITVIGEQPWGFVGVGLLAAAGLAAIGVGISYADTTAEGEARAQAWRGYAKGLKDVGSNTAVELDLDEAVPYAVSMNAKQALDKRLKQASEAGYSPLWLGRSLQAETWGAVGFYPYWTTFHAGVSPSVGAGSSGAASGSGGAGGGF